MSQHILMLKRLGREGAIVWVFCRRQATNGRFWAETPQRFTLKSISKNPRNSCHFKIGLQKYQEKVAYVSLTALLEI